MKNGREKDHEDEYKKRKIIETAKKELGRMRLSISTKDLLGEKLFSKLKPPKKLSKKVLKFGEEGARHSARQEARRKAGQYERLVFKENEGR
ncbi:MAG: hypothetical protein FWF97_01625 [Alphaproteobacteria bacterium]|nr:hypothetical protein [Alphaproteobacteria bacterium]